MSDIKDLIFSADSISLDEYIDKSLQYLEPDNAFFRKDILMKEMLKAGQNGHRFNRIQFIIKLKNIPTLPLLFGIINLMSIADDAYFYPWQTMIGDREDEDIEFFKFTDADETITEPINYDLNEVNIISGFEDNDIIVSVPELSEHYFILYQDTPVPYLISTSDEGLIKTLISLSLLSRSKDTFMSVIEEFKDYKKRPLSNSVETLYRVITNANPIKKEWGLSEEDENKYWKLRDC